MQWYKQMTPSCGQSVNWSPCSWLQRENHHWSRKRTRETGSNWKSIFCFSAENKIMFLTHPFPYKEKATEEDYKRQSANRPFLSAFKSQRLSLWLISGLLLCFLCHWERISPFWAPLSTSSFNLLIFLYHHYWSLFLNSILDGTSVQRAKFCLQSA